MASFLSTDDMVALAMSGLKLKDIAERAGVSVSAVQQRLAGVGVSTVDLARKDLFQKIGELYEKGCNDAVISKTLRIDRDVVADWRKLHGKPAIRKHSTVENRPCHEPRPHSSRYKGVTRVKGMWAPWMAQLVAVIDGEKKRFYLGCYAHEVQAALAYDDMAVKIFGSKAVTNASRGLLVNKFDHRLEDNPLLTSTKTS